MSVERAPDQLLVAGMFRSGTTLLSRILSAHPRCLLVADPFVYFFKAYRNALLAGAGPTRCSPDEPTSDLFHDPEHGLWRELIERGELSEPVPAPVLDAMRAEIRRWKAEQHPRLCARLDEVGGESFAALYRGLSGLCLELYGQDRDVALAGTKVSWCEEYLPALARAFPAMRFVFVVRDLRAVCASQNARQGSAAGKRPLLFYVRHWRKSVGLFLRHLRRDPLFAGRALLVRYEDLVEHPRRTVEELCALTGLSGEPAMLDVAGYRDLREEGAWRPNSSFEAGEGIYRSSLERWRWALRPDEVAAIESLAWPELRAMGYRLTGEPLPPRDCLALDCEPAPEELADWIRPLACAAYLRDERARAAELEKEERRLAILDGSLVVPPEEEERAFLDHGTLELLRQAAGRGPLGRAAAEGARPMLPSR